MKLSQYKEKKNHKKLAFVIVAIIFLIGGIILEKTFANFKAQKSFKVMEGNFIYEGSGDVMFAFYKDNQEVTSIPTLEEGYVYEKSECNNKASIEWNSGKWAPLVTNLTTSKTKCDIYFKKGSGSGLYNALENLIDKKEGQLIYDGTDDNNLRFIGADPDNYVTFNNETWRIIGVMNNIVDAGEKTGSHLKIIRGYIGTYSWDSSSESINNGYGVNEWNEADIQKVLNENYYKKEAGGTCYSDSNNKTTSCPKWEEIGLSDEAKAIVSKIKWNTGTIPVDFSGGGYNSITPPYMYEAERSENTGKICQQNTVICSDEVERKTSWKGFVGLMYPSDFGYATSGRNEEQRQLCLTISMYNWTARDVYSDYSDCHSYSWLSRDIFDPNFLTNAWTMTPVPLSNYANKIFYISGSGYLNTKEASTPGAIRVNPVVYLNSNIKIEPNDASDYGSKTNPYKLTT